MSHSGTEGIAGSPGRQCETCEVWVGSYARSDCKSRHRHMKQTGALNKVGCWRPVGTILIWGETDEQGEQTV